MRILLWHGYLLGGTGSNVYTRALAREWSRAGHDVTVVCQERAPEQYDLAGARVVGRSCPAGCCRCSSSTATRGSRRGCSRTSPTTSRRAYVEANAAALRELLPADLVFTNHVLMGGPVGAATGAPFRVKAHGSELEYSMRGRPELERWGAEALARRRGDVRRLAPHPRGARGRRRPRRPRPRGAAGRRRRRVRAAGRATRRSPTLIDEARATRRTRATRASACRTRATPSGSRRSSPATSRPSSTSGS